jgi:sugar lactone lactonase YvrE
MNENRLLKIAAGIVFLLGLAGPTFADNLYASYNGSQLGFTTRNTGNLAQSAYCTTGVNASGIAVDAAHNIYLAAGNHLIKYSASCHKLVDMTFPDPSINYTGVTVIGNTLYATYNGSQLGFTTRNTANLEQSAYCTTGVNASGIAVDASHNLYLAAGNHLIKYSANCQKLVDMTFPDPAINYTGVTVIGNTLYASYNGSQLGFTTRNTANLEQSAWCTTGINESGIAVDSSRNIFLSSSNHLYKYSATCRQLVNMTFPIATINYTGVAVK